jgi:hypothetical protein
MPISISYSTLHSTLFELTYLYHILVLGHRNYIES